MIDDAPGRRSLADRRASQTRADIEAAAIPLFVANGFDATSMEDVAEAAGVSRRTLYRYFDRKSDIVFEAPRRWLGVFEDAYASGPPDEPVRAAFRRALLAVAAYVEEESDQVLAAFSILASSDELGAAHRRSDQAWVERYVELMAPSLGDDPTAHFAGLVTAMAIVAGMNAAMIAWASNYPAVPAVALMSAMLDQLDDSWPEPCR